MTTVKKNIKKRGRVKKYEDINEGDSVRLQLKEKTNQTQQAPPSPSGEEAVGQKCPFFFLGHVFL